MCLTKRKERRMADVVKDENAKVEPKKEESKEPTLAELKAAIKALEEKEAKSKEAISKACTDAADWKRKYRETLDGAEREKQEQAERFADMEARLKAFEAKDRVNTYTQKLVGAGYPIEQASKMAAGLPDGIPDTFFEEQRAFLENTKQQLKTQALNSQPDLAKGTPPEAVKAEDKETENLRRWMGL